MALRREGAVAEEIIKLFQGSGTLVLDEARFTGQNHLTAQVEPLTLSISSLNNPMRGRYGARVYHSLSLNVRANERFEWTTLRRGGSHLAPAQVGASLAVGPPRPAGLLHLALRRGHTRLI